MFKTLFRSQLLFTVVVSNLAMGVVANSVYAAKLISYCHMDHATKQVVGKNISIKYPIASVSKLFTSLVATTSYALDHKFVTQVFATPVGNGQFDVHIEGSPDPYFNRFKMHMIISRLNEANVTNIRKLTFDENVKYLHETDAFGGFRAGKTFVRPLILKAEMSFPTKELVKAELQQTTTILKDYSLSYASAARAGIALYKNPKFKVTTTDFKSSADFKETGKEIKMYVASQDLQTIIKSMNWNSNNFAANRLLMASGGLDKLHKFYFDVLKMSPTELSFVNGSGQNHDLDGNGRLYNEASCNVVVRTVRALKNSVEKQNRKLENVMSVMGTDKGSTVAGPAYANAITRGSVVAKTGTIGTNITLAGMINGVKGPHYFMFNTELAMPGAKVKNKSRFMAQEEKRARALISSELVKLVKSIGGAKPFDYKTDNPLGDSSLDNYDEDSANELMGLINTGPDEPTEEETQNLNN